MEEDTPRNDLRTLRDAGEGQPVGVPPASTDAEVPEGAGSSAVNHSLLMMVPWAVFALAAGVKFWRLTSAWRQRGMSKAANTDQFRRSLERIWAQDQQSA